MNLSKCTRCGCFYATPEDVCPKCTIKDNYEKANLQNFIEENEIPNSLERLCENTHISLKNMNRFLRSRRICSS